MGQNPEKFWQNRPKSDRQYRRLGGTAKKKKQVVEAALGNAVESHSNLPVEQKQLFCRGFWVSESRKRHRYAAGPVRFMHISGGMVRKLLSR